MAGAGRKCEQTMLAGRKEHIRKAYASRRQIECYLSPVHAIPAS